MTEVGCNTYVKVKCNKPYVLKAPKQHGNECDDSCSSSCIDYSALKGDKREPPHCNDPCFLKYYGPECSESSSSSSSCDTCNGCANGCGACRSCSDYKKKKHLIHPLKDDKCSESSSSSSSECLPKVKVCIDGKHKEFCHQPVDDCPKCPKVCVKPPTCDYVKLGGVPPPLVQACPASGHRPCYTGQCHNAGQTAYQALGVHTHGSSAHIHHADNHIPNHQNQYPHNNNMTTYNVVFGKSDRHPNNGHVGNYDVVYVNGYVAPILHVTKGKSYRFAVNCANSNGQFYLSRSPVADGSMVEGASPISNGSFDYTVNENSPSVLYYHVTGYNGAGNAIVVHNSKH